MGLNADVKKRVAKKLEEYEGRVNHLYLDAKGYVTIGVGHLVKNRNAVAALVLCKTKNSVPAQLASLKEKQDEYDTIVKQPVKYMASWYKQHTTLVMKKEDIDALLDKHIDSFFQELIGIYQKSKGCFDEFDNLPENVQLALFDMIFNLGANQIVNDFPKFDQAIKAGDWATAARESNRPDVNIKRNNYVKSLFLTVK